MIKNKCEIIISNFWDRLNKTKPELSAGTVAAGGTPGISDTAEHRLRGLWHAYRTVAIDNFMIQDRL